ncbi:MAG: hypothetical protein B6U76_02515 [Desulfurococcales archaeon ex4484_217_2]|nr:MAG: hypothetical protein B6U76_02515 [Desulfurococcales archaeon ex4484_217_2]
MGMSTEELKSKIISLLERDREFRYTVAGLIGLREILEKLDRHEQELRRLREDMNKLREDMIEGFRRHDKMFMEISRRLGSVELELGALNESFYCKALWDDLKDELKEKGEKIVLKRRNARVNGEDIDMLVVTDRKVYVVEAKVKPKHEDVGRLLAKADVVKKHYKDKEVVAILTGTIIGREIEEYAKEKKVKVYSY